MGDRYSFSLTTFSPSGKLVQIEHALAAVSQGAASIGVKAKNGIVICTEKKLGSTLMLEKTIERVSIIANNVGMVYSGMGPDARVLLAEARKAAQSYKMKYGEEPSTAVLVKDIAAVMQEFTQRGGVRPFGVSLLVAGWDENQGPSMYQVDPSGSFFAWKATAIGKNMVNAKTFLEKRFSDDMELEDAVHTALLTLKDSFEGEMTPDSVEVGLIVCPAGGVVELNDANIAKPVFKKLSEVEIKDYLSNIV